VLGDESVLDAEPLMGAEDFSYMAQSVPGCFLMLGVKNKEWDRMYNVHRADFRLDEDALPIGAAALAAAAIKWMEGEH
jgi:amidohydrolase